jgi:hypothetical protein
VIPCASRPPRPSTFSDYSLRVHHLVTGMTGISFHMQWLLTSQLHGSVSQREQLVFVTDQTQYPYQTRSLPAQFLTPVHGMEYSVGLVKEIGIFCTCLKSFKKLLKCGLIGPTYTVMRKI